MGYTKLWHKIVTSSIWDADDKTRILWITMLALANKDGYVESSFKSLAMLARITTDECLHALEVLSSADEDSRTKTDDGKRIAQVEGGWQIINYQKYRDSVSEDPHAIQNRERQKRHREKKALLSVTSRDPAYAYASEFASIWKLYPDKVGKPAAIKAYIKYREEGDTFEEVLEGVNRYISYIEQKKQKTGFDQRFKNGSTWFNQRGWKDEYVLESVQTEIPLDNDGGFKAKRFEALKAMLCDLFKRPADQQWTSDEMARLVELSRTGITSGDLDIFRAWFTTREKKYLPQSIMATMTDFTKHMDAARLWKGQS